MIKRNKRTKDSLLLTPVTQDRALLRESNAEITSTISLPKADHEQGNCALDMDQTFKDTGLLLIPSLSPELAEIWHKIKC